MISTYHSCPLPRLTCNYPSPPPTDLSSLQSTAQRAGWGSWWGPGALLVSEECCAVPPLYSGWRGRWLEEEKGTGALPGRRRRRRKVKVTCEWLLRSLWVGLTCSVSVFAGKWSSALILLGFGSSSCPLLSPLCCWCSGSFKNKHSWMTQTQEKKGRQVRSNTDEVSVLCPSENHCTLLSGGLRGAGGEGGWLKSAMAAVKP